MPGTQRGPISALRVGASWGSRLEVCAVAFVLTALAVYLIGAATRSQSPNHVAQATVCYQLPASAAGGAPGGSGSHWEAVRQEALADDSLRWAVSEAGLEAPDGDAEGSESPSDLVETVRANLRVEVRETDTPGRLAVAIVFSGQNAQQATALVNHLAQRCAERERTRNETSAHEKYLQAREAADYGRRRWTAAKAELDGFLQNHFEQLPVLSKGLLAWSEARTATPPPRPAPAATRFIPARPIPVRRNPPRTKTADNPAWVDVSRQIDDLENQRAGLLKERTPLHPEIRQIEGRIADLQARLASIPRQIPGHVADSEPELPAPPDQPIISPLPPRLEQDRGDAVQEGDRAPWPPAAPTAEVFREAAPTNLPPAGRPTQSPRPDLKGPDLKEIAGQHVEAAETFAGYRHAVDQAEIECSRLDAAERRAWEDQFHTPQIDVELAGRCEDAAGPRSGTQLPLVALVAGLAAAVSMGLISMVAGGEPPLTSAAEVQAALPVPVVGRIVGPRGANPSCAVRRSSPGQHPWTLLSLAILLTICIGALAVAVMRSRLGW
jgi:hypothetical protein